MPKVTYVSHEGQQTTVDVPVGENVMRGALYNAIEGIAGECGGAPSCATCHVYVDEAWVAKVGAANDVENELLEGVTSERKSCSRLSCQIAMSDALDGVVIHMPETQY